MKKKKNTVVIHKFVIIGIILSFIAIVGQLTLVTLKPKTDGINLKTFADNRNTVNETLYAKRGTVYDVNGNTLGQSVNSYTVIAYLDESRTNNIKNPQHVVNINKTAEELSKILDAPIEYMLSRLSEDLYQVEFGMYGRGISELDKEKIEKLNLPGIDFITSTKRFYKMGSFAPYTIGYARMDKDGKINGEMGVESFFNEELTGTDGKRIYQKDAYGYQIPNTEVSVVNPESGSDIYLTLDNNIQLYTETAVGNILKENEADWVTMSIVDGYTGAILSTASSPTFNLNTLEIESYVNPLTGYTYEPGSTMKIFSFMASMEAGQYKGDELYQSGTIAVDDSLIKDFNNVGWGQITYDVGFTWSSNVAATKLALNLGSKALLNYYNSLGFGKKVGITLPGEVNGKIAINYKTELATASFGQGITITPIQMLQALTALTNDGTVIKPYIVDKVVNSDTEEVVFESTKTEINKVASTETVSAMTELMRETVSSHRTDAFFYEPDTVSIIGKTGTAQIASSGGYLTGANDYIKSFAGVFPYDEPRYIIYVAVSKYQGPISNVGYATANLIAETGKYLAIEDPEETPKVETTYTIKNYVGSTTEKFLKDNEKRNIKPIIIGDGDIILSQYPNSGKVLSGSKVFISTNSKEVKMANINNWTRNEVNQYCSLLGIECLFNGYGNVVNSNIPTDTIITKDTKLIVELN